MAALNKGNKDSDEDDKVALTATGKKGGNSLGKKKEIPRQDS